MSIESRTDPIPVRVEIKNAGPDRVSGSLRMRVIDDWTIEPAGPVAFTIDGAASKVHTFSMKPGPRVYDALYPIHAYVDFEAGGTAYQAHPILIFEADFPKTEESAIDVKAPAGWRHARSWPKVVVKGAVTDAGRPIPVTVYRGKRGLLDARFRFGSGAEAVEFRGIAVTVHGAELLGDESAYRLVSLAKEPAGGAYRMRHTFRSDDETFDVLVDLRLGASALGVRVSLENTPPDEPWDVTYLENVALGAWSKPVHRVYAGAGNVIEAPRVFTPGYEGHRLSTSYVGAEFENGPALVLAVDVPPNQLRVVPADRTFTLDTPHAQTLTFIPGANVWEAAKVWRELDGRQAAPGVDKLAGRFTFDLWWGDFRRAAAMLERSFQYGLTDSIVVWHGWQRWGYDYRLPDIMPATPRYGGHEAFRALSDTCRAHGVLFAPHDNYIDFYPDSEAFSYDRIAFSGKDVPDGAWCNRGREAQSMKWRADCIRPFLESNVKAVKEAYAPTAYFIDVWSSRPPYDYWTRDGEFRSRLETRDIWRESFAWIRNELGNDAPQISESGNDQMVGWSNGAQANQLRVDDRPPRRAGHFVWRVNCQDAERIPWFDMAHHHRFVLQGAGYSSRYAGGLDGDMHGIYSDDYIATEVLAGRAPMVSSAFGRDVVRKYWLLSELSRALAMQRIDTVEFVDDNLHRQCVHWQNGATVWVNRSAEDWTVEGHVLPQYGFYARVPDTVEAAIERRRGIIVEWSHSTNSAYVNARGATEFRDRSPEYLARQNTDGRSVEMGPVRTVGGVRLTRSEHGVVIMPLPDGLEFDVQVAWDAMPWDAARPHAVAHQNDDGETVARTPVSDSNGVLTVSCDPGVFAYHAQGD